MSGAGGTVIDIGPWVPHDDGNWPETEALIKMNFQKTKSAHHYRQRVLGAAELAERLVEELTRK